MKKLLPVIQSHGKVLTKTIDEQIGSNDSAVIEGKCIKTWTYTST